MKYAVIEMFGNDEVKKARDIAIKLAIGNNFMIYEFDDAFLKAIKNDDNVRVMCADADFLRNIEKVELKQFGFYKDTYIYIIYFFIRCYELTKRKKSFATLITFVPELLKVVYKDADIKTITRRYITEDTDKEIVERIHKFFDEEKETFARYVRRMRAKLKVNVDYVLNEDDDDISL